ncbi:MAG: asparagine synthetase B, partial [Candidatus Zixiibacteriota bacterium]
KGFMGQVTGFRKSLLKKHVTVLAQPDNYDEVRYIHGNLGRGTFTFLSGHDPEDYQHMVNDPPTDLSLHKHSPGYRLILNNILFPAAKKKERKT